MASGFEELVAAAKMPHLDGEPLTLEAANLAGQTCEHRCTTCNGDTALHHWLDDCADEGDPIQVCKHCPAWRPYPDEADECD